MQVSVVRPIPLEGIRERIVGVDQQVPLLDGTVRPYINFDNAASTPALGDVKVTLDRLRPRPSVCPPGPCSRT